eukprot:c30515_g1_i1 orf=337-663(-)
MEAGRNHEQFWLLESNASLPSFRQIREANHRRVESSYADQRQPLCDITHACVSNVVELLPQANLFLVDHLLNSVGKACATSNHFRKRVPVKLAHPMDQTARNTLRCMR